MDTPTDRLLQQIDEIATRIGDGDACGHELAGPVLEYIALGGHPDPFSPDNGRTLLITCIESCPDPRPSLELLAHGADANVDYCDRTPLLYAVQRCHPGAGAIVSALLAAGADVNATNGGDQIQTALITACAEVFDGETLDGEGVLHALLAWGANLNVCDCGLDSPLSKVVWMAAVHPEHHEPALALARAFLQLGADVNVGNPLVRGAEQWSDGPASLSMMALLLDAGANVDAFDVDRLHTALHCACARGNELIATELIRRGANVNAEDFEERRPVHYAARNGHAGLVRILANAGADVDGLDGLDGLDAGRL
jgi:ankyrin repeat protein